MRNGDKMNRTVLAIVCAGLFTVGGVGVVGAALQPHDLYTLNDGLLTYDTETDLEWLDLTETVNLTFNQVSTMLDAGDPYEGFRYASIDEVEALWLSVGITNFTNTFTTGNYDGVIELISLMGEINTHGPQASQDPGHIGLTPYNNDFAYRSFLTIDDPDNGSARASLDSYFTETDYIVPDRMGHYLVRTAAQAELVTIGTATYNDGTGAVEYNLIYDEDISAVWLDYSNAPASWADQNAWAAGLNTVGTLTYNIDPNEWNVGWGSNEWRLPIAGINPSTGHYQTDSEMGHLFYTALGLDAFVTSTAQLNASNFDNLTASLFYWLATEYTIGSEDYAWFFVMRVGVLAYGKPSGINYYGDGYGLAIRNANVSPAPELIAIDIKPESCPNPINTRSKGVLPVAILSTDEFDVTQVDPATVQLEGVAPLRWSIEDVAAPYAGDMEACDIYACNEVPSDGYTDLSLKFETQEVAAALGTTVSDGDCLLLELTGNLKEEFGGTPIAGKDVVVILKKK